MQCSSDSYASQLRYLTDCRMKKFTNPPEKDNVKTWWTHISRSVVDPHVRGNNLIHCVMDPQVKKGGSVTQIATGSRQTTLLEALRDIQFNSYKPY